MSLTDHQRAEMALGDFLADVRDEIGVSRAMRPRLLMPASDLYGKAAVIAVALRQGDAQAVEGECRALAVLAVRVALDGSPAFPAITAPPRLGDIFNEHPETAS